MQKQMISHGRKTKQKHLPRINTELHGRKQKISHGLTRKNTEGRKDRSGRICHGLTRKNTEGRKDRSGRICHGRTRNFTEGKHCIQSRKRERLFFLARANTTFIAYLYKPEAQAKVLQIPVYYSHIIPSLALQACKTRDTVKSPFPHPPLDKKRWE